MLLHPTRHPPFPRCGLIFSLIAMTLVSVGCQCGKTPPTPPTPPDPQPPPTHAKLTSIEYTAPPAGTVLIGNTVAVTFTAVGDPGPVHWTLPDKLPPGWSSAKPADRKLVLTGPAPIGSSSEPVKFPVKAALADEVPVETVASFKGAPRTIEKLNPPIRKPPIPSRIVVDYLFDIGVTFPVDEKSGAYVMIEIDTEGLTGDDQLTYVRPSDGKSATSIKPLIQQATKAGYEFPQERFPLRDNEGFIVTEKPFIARFSGLNVVDRLKIHKFRVIVH